MQNNESNTSNDYLQLIENIVCTDEGEKQLKATSSKLRGTERQLLLLLRRNDNMSIQASEKLIKKVSLQIMLDAGLIADRNGSQKLSQLIQGFEGNINPITKNTDNQPITNKTPDTIDDLIRNLKAEQDSAFDDSEFDKMAIAKKIQDNLFAKADKTVIAKNLQKKITKARLEHLPDPEIQVASGIFFT